VAPRGFVPQFEGGRATVSNLDPESFAARTGMRDGDQIVSVNGQILLGHTDWQRATLQFDPSRPFVLQVDRDGHRFTATLPLSAGVEEWRRATQGTGVLMFRLVQFGTEFVEPDWCTRGHAGVVLRGAIDLDVAGTAVTFRAGDGIFIPAGERTRHRHRATLETATLFLVEEA